MAEKSRFAVVGSGISGQIFGVWDETYFSFMPSLKAVPTRSPST